MMGKASDAMWIFSTVLCAVVGIMVAVGVGYQIHLDRVSKRKKKDFQTHQRGGGVQRLALLYSLTINKLLMQKYCTQ